MTEEEVKTAYLEWIENETNNKFDVDNMPGGIRLALDQLVEIDPLSFNVTSEKIEDMSQTFASDGNIPGFIYNWINPYRKLRSL